ncbi:MAG TPA: folate-binding protein [Thermopetrobacter sp.]|nr:folate-binding protein [Thermopetrobacter sp.]
MATLMTDRAVVEVSGPDARDFLQSLVTNDVAGTKPGAMLWAGLLTPRGKILFDFFIVDAGDGQRETRFLLDVPAARRQALEQRLGMYRLRREVEITPREDLAVAVDIDAAEGRERGALAIHADPRFADMGSRAILPAAAASGLSTDAGDWHARRIALGLPDSEADIGSEKLFPHEADFDCLNGVSFTKGCYVGQEVVSRMHHRGTARSRLVPVAGAAPLRGGMTVTAGERRIGEVFSTAGKRAIALIRLDRAAAAIEEGLALLAGGEIPLRLIRPPWVCFEMPADNGNG